MSSLIIEIGSDQGSKQCLSSIVLVSEVNLLRDSEILLRVNLPSDRLGI